jgi:hypothetical protein
MIRVSRNIRRYALGVAYELPVGISDIAELADVTEVTVRKWRQRHADFPPPRGTVSGRPVWDWPDVRAWLEHTGRLD